MTTAAESARAKLTEAERRIAEAEAAAARAAADFEASPSAKTHGASAVATQVATNARKEGAVAAAALAECERSEQLERLKLELGKASTKALHQRVEPALKRIRELHAELVTLVAGIEAECAAQHTACRRAGEIANTLHDATPVPAPVAPSLLRAVVGVRIAADLYESGAKFAIGLEPHTYCAPRPEPPPAHPAREQWRAARAIALPADTFLPRPTFDYHLDLADAPTFFHRPPVGGRPQRFGAT